MKSRCRQALAFSENRRSAAIFCFYRAPIMRGTRVASAIRSVWEAPFSALTQRGARTASAYSSLTGGVFFTEIQQGVALCGAREFAAPAAGAKRKDNLRFSFLFELLPFPYLLVWRRLPTCDRSETENGRGFLLPCFSQSVRKVRYITATQAVKFPQAQHDRVAQLFNTLYRTAPMN